MESDLPLGIAAGIFGTVIIGDEQGACLLIQATS